MRYTVIFALAAALSIGSALAKDCASCGGCGSGAACQPAPVEEQHCHWLEVTGTEPGSQAEAGGILPGDVVHSYGGRTVGCLKDLRGAMVTVESGPVEIVLMRSGAPVKVELQPGKLGVFLKEWANDIVPDSDAVIIDGVPPLGWHTGKTATELAALEAAQQAQGDPADYTFLSGASGQAFRFQFFAEWCPSSPYPGVGAPTLDRALTSRGLESEHHVVAPDGKNKPGILAAIKASIDAGVPVLGGGVTDKWETGVVCGYQKAGEELFCRSYGDTRKGYELAHEFPWTVLILKKAGEPDNLRSAYMGFGYTHTDLTTEKYDRYYSGLAALREWAKRLRTEDFSDRDSSSFSDVIQANYWSYVRLVDDRETGIEYLTALAEDHMPRHKPLLDSLAGIYRQEVALLAPLEEQLPCPGSCLSPGEWTSEARNAQAEVVEAALKLEEQALPVWELLSLVENR